MGNSGVANMTATTPDADADRRQVDLSRVEQWVLHDVVLSRCEEARKDERNPPWWAVDVVEKVEAGVLAFTPFEAYRLRNDLEEFAADETTPDKDAASARAIVREIEATFETPPPALRE